MSAYAGTTALIGGAVSTLIDAGACAWHHETPGSRDGAACAGMALGIVSGGLGSAAKFGGEALLGADEAAVEGNRLGWDVSSGLFGTGGYSIDMNSFRKSCFGEK